jgi:hypothetical protein
VIELISENLDPDTWRPKVKPMIHENDDNAIIGEKDSGYLYAMGIDLHCPSDKPKDVLPLPVLLHMDATHCGRSGANQLTPTRSSHFECSVWKDSLTPRLGEVVLLSLILVLAKGRMERRRMILSTSRRTFMHAQM